MERGKNVKGKNASENARGSGSGMDGTKVKRSEMWGGEGTMP